MPYTVRILSQVTPKYVVRQGPTGAVSRLNPMTVPVNPASFVRLIHSPLSFNPDLIYDGDIAELWEDSEGVATWDEIKSQTTIIAYLQSIVRAEAKVVIEKKWPLWAQNNCALGIYSSDIVSQCKTDIASVITASNTTEDAILNAASLDAALAIKATWPTL